MEQISRKAHRISTFETFEVSSDELDVIESGHPSRQNDLTFFSVAASVFASFLLVVLTTKMPAIPTWRDMLFFAILLVSGGLAIYFFSCWRRSTKGQSLIFQRIRKRAYGTFGEEGKELKPSELEELKPETPSGEPLTP
jgi:hypothetical protein